MPGASLHSVASRFRFEVFGRSLLVLGPVVTAVPVVNDVLAPMQTSSMTRTSLLWLFATSLVLAPLQSAGEEYADVLDVGQEPPEAATGGLDRQDPVGGAVQDEGSSVFVKQRRVRS